jgi:hypothetical protein
MPVLFVSHSGAEDFLLALRRYCSQIEVLVSDWNDRTGTGTPLAELVKADIRRADLVVVVLSQRASSSPWVHQEIGLAFGLNKPILSITEPGESALPGVLNGMSFIPFPKDMVETTALRVATRVSDLLSRDVVRTFSTFRDYCEWWKTIIETDYTDEPCWWAAPHDVWSWFSEARGQRVGLQYRTLIRGSLPFDRTTASIHFGGDQIVTGVEELSNLTETHICGNLTVETYYLPDFCQRMDQDLLENTSEVALRLWYESMIGRTTEIEVRLSMDPQRASGHRKRLQALFLKYWKTQASAT